LAKELRGPRGAWGNLQGAAGIPQPRNGIASGSFDGFAKRIRQDRHAERFFDVPAILGGTGEIADAFLGRRWCLSNSK
jgi:hypothetical protein